MNDRQRILDLLEKRGTVDTFFLRKNGFSGNPSQRIRELKEEGHNIVAERFTRADGRAGARYTLVEEPQLSFAC
jgi:hypothetical protein